MDYNSQIYDFVDGKLDSTQEDKFFQELASNEELRLELKEAMSKIKTLSGLLPICYSCKKIRDDKGYWNQLEAYISSHSEAAFSHSICPECAKKLYPEIYKNK